MQAQTKKRKLLGNISALVGAALLVVVVFSAIVAAPFAPKIAHAECTQDGDGSYHDDDGNPCTPISEADKGSVGGGDSGLLDKFLGALKYLNPYTWLPKIVEVFGYVILGLMALIAALGGMVLDGGMSMTLNMRGVMAQVPVVDIGWAAFRDVANILFIFILIYIAIKTILNVGETRKMLVNVIITALLINFSLFFCKVAVDASNILALSFYNQMKSLYVPPVAGAPGWMTGPASTLFASMKLGTPYNFSGNSSAAGSSSFAGAIKELSSSSALAILETLQTIEKVVLGSVMLLVFAFVLAVAGILLIIRVVTLMFLMMLSPLAVVARLLPRTQSMWNTWFAAFVNNAIYAPAFFALMYVVIRTAKDGLDYNGTIDGLASAPSDAFGVALNYIFMIILIAGTIFVAKSLSIHGASAADAMGQSASRWARGRAKSAGGWGMRNTFGRGAQAAQERLQQTSFGKTRVGSALFGGTVGAVAGAKFGSKQSYKEAEDARKKNLKERRGGIDEAGANAAQLHNTMHASGFSEADREKMYIAMNDRQKVIYEAEAQRRRDEAQQNLTNARTRIATARAAGVPPTAADQAIVNQNPAVIAQNSAILTRINGQGGYKENAHMNRDQLEKLEEVYVREFRDNPETLARHLTSTTDQDLRNHFYDKLSARDRVVMENTITHPRAGAAPLTLPPDPSTGHPMNAQQFVDAMRHSLSQEERDKTEKSERDSTRDLVQDTVRTDLQALAAEIRGQMTAAHAGDLEEYFGRAGAAMTIAGTTYNNARDASRRINQTANQATNGTLEDLGEEERETIVSGLSAGQYKAMQSSNKLSKSERETLENRRYGALGRAMGGGVFGAPRTGVRAAGTISTTMQRMSATEMAELPDEFFENPDVQNLLTPVTLEKLSSLPTGIRASIGARIRSNPAHPAYNYVKFGESADLWI